MLFNKAAKTICTYALLLIMLLKPMSAQTTLSPERCNEIAIHAKKFTGRFISLRKLAQKLTRDYRSDAEQAFSIYAWVGLHMNYTPGKYQMNPKKLLLNRHGVCQGYASLFKTLCDNAGIDCEMVKGYAKATPNQIATNNFTGRHAWNVVQIDGEWKLVDPTWGGSFYDPFSKKYYRRVEPYYFCTDPDEFKLTHTPKKDSVWFLTDSLIAKQTFLDKPIYYESYFKNKMSLENISTGTLKYNVGDSIIIALKSPNIELDTNNVNFGFTRLDQIYTFNDYHRVDDTYFFKFYADRTRSGKFYLYFNFQYLLAFRLEFTIAK